MTTKSSKKVTKKSAKAEEPTTLTIELPVEFDEAKYALAVGQILRMSVASVIENTDVGQVLAVYDDGDPNFCETIAEDAGLWIADNFIGALPFNVINGKYQGQDMLSKARDATKAAFKKNAMLRTEKTQDALEQRNRWEAQMDLQQLLRKSLERFACAIYYAAFDTNYVYQGRNAPVKDGDMTPQTAVESTIANRFANRRS